MPSGTIHRRVGFESHAEAKAGIDESKEVVAALWPLLACRADALARVARLDQVGAHVPIGLNTDPERSAPLLV
jgi:hypothetical protein